MMIPMTALYFLQHKSQLLHVFIDRHEKLFKLAFKAIQSICISDIIIFFHFMKALNKMIQHKFISKYCNVTLSLNDSAERADSIRKINFDKLGIYFIKKKILQLAV